MGFTISGIESTRPGKMESSRASTVLAPSFALLVATFTMMLDTATTPYRAQIADATTVKSRITDFVNPRVAP